MNAVNAYLRLLQPEPVTPGPRALKRMIETELSKEEPDADLIEASLDALADAEAAKPARLVRLPRAAKIALAAALVSLLCFGTAAAAGWISGVPVSRIFTLFDDRIRFNTQDATVAVTAAPPEDAALASALEAHGFTSVRLPAAFFTEDYTLTAPDFQQTELVTAANIGVHSATLNGSVVLVRYAEAAAMPAVDYPDASSPVAVTVSGVEILVFASGEGSVITYAADRTVYTVTLDCPVQTAVELAQTVR